MKVKFTKSALAFSLAILTSGVASASVVTGGSFESPDLTDGTNDVSDATSHSWSNGWTSWDNNQNISGYGAGVEDPASPQTGQTGDQYAKMTFVYHGSLDQWVRIESPSLGAVQSGYTYTFSVDMTWKGDWASGVQPQQSNQWGHSQWVSLYLNGQQFGREHGLLSRDVFQTRSIEVVVDSNGNLLSTNADVAPAVGTSLIGGDIKVRLGGGRDNGGTGGATHLLFDNVQLNAVPEPTTFGLAGLGLFCWLAALTPWRRRER